MTIAGLRDGQTDSVSIFTPLDRQPRPLAE
jgi:hypothetical protein